MVSEGELLWAPSAERVARAQLTAFQRWLLRERGLEFDSYDALWRWSIGDLEAFWGALWDYFAIAASVPYERVLGSRRMPGADWFPGARLNYAQHVLRWERPNSAALMYMSETTPLTALSWSELGASVRRLATELRQLGVQPGERVVAYLPNIPEAVIAMLATTSIGAVWSSCGPDFGARGVLDRFSQLAPKVLCCVDGYRYGGKAYDRRDELARIIAALPSLAQVIYLRRLHPHAREPVAPGALLWEELLEGPPVRAADFCFAQVPFKHPLWILFSSGTTGLPKPIVHGHGGILIEQLKLLHFHMDMHAGERMFFYTTTGWMMWNFLVSALLSDVRPLLYDGNPAYPQGDVLWQMVAQSGAGFFGASPSYVRIMEKQGIVPRTRYDMSGLQSIMLAGSPVTPECMAWFYDNVKRDLWVHSGSGGTDVCTGFVGGVVTLPIYAGEIQARQLGVAAYAYDERGVARVDQVGEMVITEPMPSMPVRLWNDEHDARYTETYFSDFPGVWRQGDFFRVNARGGCFVLGRSDATLNRHGVRIGTAEVYRSLTALDDVEDALIVNLDLPGGSFFMPLFVKLAAGSTLDEALRERIRHKLREEYSPRHVPDRIYAVPDVPYTLTGKKMEVPVRRVLSGTPVEQAANRAAMANPQALDYYVEYARTQSDYSLR